MPRVRPLLVLLAVAAAATAAPATAAQSSPLRPALQRILERGVAHAAFAIDCTYAARGAEGIAYPAWRGLQPEIYVKPYICADANAAVGGCRTPACSPERAGAALLVLAHEATHIAGISDETATECAALARPATRRVSGARTPAARRARSAPRR
ncbi:MAG: hypothetical protein ACYC1P_12540 [Gaiellaceae bacterium]